MLDTKSGSLAEQIARVAPIAFTDLERARHEVFTARINWIAEYGEYQSGGWWTASLLNESGDPDDVLIKDCEARPTRLLRTLPNVHRLIDDLGLSMMWVRLARLSANAFLWEHRDYGELNTREKYRLHIPLATNRSAFLVLNGSRIHLGTGFVWRLTPTVQHGVCNLYGPDRTHLIIDCYGDDRFERLAEAAELGDSDVERLPTPQSAELDGHLAAARRLYALGYRRPAELSLLRLFFRYTLPIGGAYDLVISLYRSLGLDDEASSWERTKDEMIGR